MSNDFYLLPASQVRAMVGQLSDVCVAIEEGKSGMKRHIQHLKAMTGFLAGLSSEADMKARDPAAEQSADDEPHEEEEEEKQITDDAEEAEPPIVLTTKTKKRNADNLSDGEEEEEVQLAHIFPRTWSREEDTKLVTERDAGRAFKLIAKEMGVRAMILRERFGYLKAKERANKKQKTSKTRGDEVVSPPTSPTKLIDRD